MRASERARYSAHTHACARAPQNQKENNWGRRELAEITILVCIGYKRVPVCRIIMLFASKVVLVSVHDVARAGPLHDERLLRRRGHIQGRSRGRRVIKIIEVNLGALGILTTVKNGIYLCRSLSPSARLSLNLQAHWHREVSLSTLRAPRELYQGREWRYSVADVRDGPGVSTKYRRVPSCMHRTLSLCVRARVCCMCNRIMSARLHTKHSFYDDGASPVGGYSCMHANTLF